MTVGIYVPYFDPRPAGLGVYIHEVCGRIAERVDRPVLFTCTPDTVPLALSRRAEVVQMAGFPRSAGGAIRFAHRQAWLHALFPRLCARHGIDVLFSPFHEGSARPPVPQVVVIHDLTPIIFPSSYFHPIARAYFRSWLPRVLAHSSRVVAVSENTRRDLVTRLGANASRIEVVSEGYDPQVFTPATEERVKEARQRAGVEGAYLLYGGTLARHKNPAILPGLLQGVRARGMDLKLVLCGRTDAGDFRAVAQSFADRGLTPHVVTPGYVDAGDLAALMSGATAFVFPSHYEGFGLAPLAAMASGAVVLSSDRASLPEVVGDGGVLLDPDDVRAWVDAVARVYMDPAHAADLRARALVQAARFDWDDTADRIVEILRQESRQPVLR